MISIDGSTGEVFLGAMPVVPSPVETYLESGLDGRARRRRRRDRRAGQGGRPAADPRRRVAGGWRSGPTPTPPRTPPGRDRLGAQGIGLCRTEHMFLGDRRVLIERVILADTADERDDALAALLPLQRKDFIELLDAMDGLPVTIRLLDPPLHEFLPDRTELAVRVALAEASGETGAGGRRPQLLAAVERLHESNPMLGLRGVRLGLLTSRACSRCRSAPSPRPPCEQITAGKRPEGRDHGAAGRLGDGAAPGPRRDRGDPRRGRRRARASRCTIPIGTMIELPRAALTAHRIAEAADFFSFGTNDLTQTTWGFSRDDVEAAFFAAYLDKGVFTVSPFETIDADGVGRLVRDRRRGGPRDQARTSSSGVCGEHGGDPESIHFFHKTGLDYVSCSPFRVPVARLEAGRAAVS